MSLNNFRASGCILTKLPQTTWPEVGVITRVQLLEGPPPKNLGGPKNVQISARFLTTFDFDREYLRNDFRYPKSQRNVIDSDSTRVPWKTSGELWSTNKKVLLANIEPPKWNFRGRLYFSPYGVLRLEIFTRARDCQTIDRAHMKWDGASPKNLIVKI